jgi:hypothetical protein
VLKEQEAIGAVELWPRKFASVPVSTDRLFEKAADAVCSPGKTLLAAAFAGGGLSTCIAARRGDDGFDRIIGPERLRREMGLLSGDWTRDYRHLARAVELSVGPLALGAFAEEATWRRLLSDAAPGSWATAVAVRDVVLHPVAPAIAAALGVDLGRAMLHSARTLARRVGGFDLDAARSLFAPAVGRVLEVVPDELQETLGVDLWGWIRRFAGDESDPE